LLRFRTLPGRSRRLRSARGHAALQRAVDYAAAQRSNARPRACHSSIFALVVGRQGHVPPPLNVTRMRAIGDALPEVARRRGAATEAESRRSRKSRSGSARRHRRRARRRAAGPETICNFVFAGRRSHERAVRHGRRPAVLRE
jgi:hypothetical protein